MRLIERFKSVVSEPTHIAPLVVFRIVFGFMMFVAILRFWLNGWIESLYIQPKVFFPYLGFEWIKPLGNPGMYLVFATMAIAAFCIAIGLAFRLSAFLFFILFTYVELIDKTPYLNHYYFICLASFLLFLLPANKFFSVDAKLGWVQPASHIPKWMPLMIKLQLATVYFFAGIAKLNYDWLFEAQPLKIWLPARADMPLIGDLLAREWVAYVFSWIGMLFDLLIPFVLFNSRFRLTGYAFVVIFHVLTWMLFNIGMFPFVMIGSTLIFFSPQFHLKVIQVLSRMLRVRTGIGIVQLPETRRHHWLKRFFVVYMLIQLCLPFRYVLYPGKLFWTEQGFRFSWRVMLMEKSGTCTFYVCEGSRKACIEINNRDYLTRFQEKMMSTQPDMILQFAHMLRDDFTNKTISRHGLRFTFTKPSVYVDSYVSLNGKGSQRFIDPEVDLAAKPQNLFHKSWILPFKE